MILFLFLISCVCFPLCQMVMMTPQGCPGCLPRPPVKTWHRLHRCPMAAATSAWQPAVRRKEVLVCRTPASSATNPSGINITRVVSCGDISVHWHNWCIVDNETNVIFCCIPIFHSWISVCTWINSILNITMVTRTTKANRERSEVNTFLTYISREYLKTHFKNSCHTHHKVIIIVLYITHVASLSSLFFCSLLLAEKCIKR